MSIARRRQAISFWSGAASSALRTHSLSAVPDRREVAWQNPDADAQYTVTPVRSYENRAGRYCREYITEAVIGGRTEKVYGTACRQPDGAWELMK